VRTPLPADGLVSRRLDRANRPMLLARAAPIFWNLGRNLPPPAPSCRAPNPTPHQGHRLGVVILYSGGDFAEIEANGARKTATALSLLWTAQQV